MYVCMYVVRALSTGKQPQSYHINMGGGIALTLKDLLGLKGFSVIGRNGVIISFRFSAR